MHSIVGDCSSQDLTRLESRARVDVDTLLRDIVPEEDLEQVWENGLAPDPLYSFYHDKSRVRHWAWTEDPVVFLCNRQVSEHHLRGGCVQVDLLHGMCQDCVRVAKSDKKVQYAEYMKFGVASLEKQ